jgi:hypothetical protein
MSDQFRRTIADLWDTLALPEPVFSDMPSIILSIDATDVTLAESQDGRHIDLSSAAGRLSGDQIGRTMQIRDILTANLQTLLSMRAAVSIENMDIQHPDVVVRSVYAYSGGTLGHLVNALGDVVALSQAHGIKLQNAAAGRSEGRGPARIAEEDYSMIFRP